jgi:hypothetical protein
MGTCACTEQYFFYNINYDDEASQPRISGKKLISSTHSGGGYGSMGMPGSMGPPGDRAGGARLSER